jgi:hypothetical protein
MTGLLLQLPLGPQQHRKEQRVCLGSSSKINGLGGLEDLDRLSGGSVPPFGGSFNLSLNLRLLSGSIGDGSIGGDDGGAIHLLYRVKQKRA